LLWKNQPVVCKAAYNDDDVDDEVDGEAGDDDLWQWDTRLIRVSIRHCQQVRWRHDPTTRRKLQHQSTTPSYQHSSRARPRMGQLEVWTRPLALPRRTPAGGIRTKPMRNYWVYFNH